MRSRIEEIERRKRDALHKIAPGLGTMLVPTRTSPASASTTQGPNISAPAPEIKERNVMDDLVDQLAALESKNAAQSNSVSSPHEGLNQGG